MMLLCLLFFLPSLLCTAPPLTLSLFRDTLTLTPGLPAGTKVGDAAYSIVLNVTLQNGTTYSLPIAGNFTERAQYEMRGVFKARQEFLFGCVNLEPEKLNTGKRLMATHKDRGAESTTGSPNIPSESKGDKIGGVDDQSEWDDEDDGSQSEFDESQSAESENEEDSDESEDDSASDDSGDSTEDDEDDGATPFSQQLGDPLTNNNSADDSPTKTQVTDAQSDEEEGDEQEDESDDEIESRQSQSDDSDSDESQNDDDEVEDSDEEDNSDNAVLLAQKVQSTSTMYSTVYETATPTTSTRKKGKRTRATPTPKLVKHNATKPKDANIIICMECEEIKLPTNQTIPNKKLITPDRQFATVPKQTDATAKESRKKAGTTKSTTKQKTSTGKKTKSTKKTSGSSKNSTHKSVPIQKLTSLAIALAAVTSATNPVWVSQVVQSSGSASKIALFDGPNCSPFPGTSYLRSYDWCVSENDGTLSLNCKKDTTKSMSNRGFTLPSGKNASQVYPTRSIGIFGPMIGTQSWTQTHQKEIGWVSDLAEMVSTVLCAVNCPGCCQIGQLVAGVTTDIGSGLTNSQGFDANDAVNVTKEIASGVKNITKTTK